MMFQLSSMFLEDFKYWSFEHEQRLLNKGWNFFDWPFIGRSLFLEGSKSVARARCDIWTVRFTMIAREATEISSISLVFNWLYKEPLPLSAC